TSEGLDTRARPELLASTFNALHLDRSGEILRGGRLNAFRPWRFFIRAVARSGELAALFHFL
ncbi:MAG: hypothetical protein SGPRY_010330, partial [Prymnesium sp.]